MSAELKQPSFMTIKEVAFELQVSERTVYLWVSNNTIPFRKIGGVLRFPREEIMARTNPETPKNGHLKVAQIR